MRAAVDIDEHSRKYRIVGEFDMSRGFTVAAYKSVYVFDGAGDTL